jgi:hypothetical protein
MTDFKLLPDRSIKDMVKDSQVHFAYYRDSELWYSTDDGFLFPVPTSDVGTATFQRDDKAILFMRYIRKQVDRVGDWSETQ